MKTDLTIEDVAQLEIIRRLRAFANEMRAMLAEGRDLRHISKWSYDQRESGRDVPYMSVLNKAADGTVTCIYASPTVRQAGLRRFFADKAQGSCMPRYTLRIIKEEEQTHDTSVEFFEKLGKGKDNKRSLI